MNERIRELAQAAGLGFHGESITMLQDELPETVLGRFAELIAAAEREECALICEAFGKTLEVDIGDSFAEEIRARRGKA